MLFSYQNPAIHNPHTYNMRLNHLLPRSSSTCYATSRRVSSAIRVRVRAVSVTCTPRYVVPAWAYKYLTRIKSSTKTRNQDKTWTCICKTYSFIRPIKVGMPRVMMFWYVRVLWQSAALRGLHVPIDLSPNPVRSLVEIGNSFVSRFAVIWYRIRLPPHGPPQRWMKVCRSIHLVFCSYTFSVQKGVFLLYSFCQWYL